MMLGKLPPRYDERTLMLANYVADLPPPPERVDWADSVRISWGMLANDRVGDCAEAAPGHAITSWTASATGKQIIPTDLQILAAYSAITGYDPADPSTDRGSVELDVLRYWRTHGIAGHKIAAFAACEPQNRLHIKDAIYLFGGVLIGLALPKSAQSQRSVWSLPPQGPQGAGERGSWGGHAVWVTSYDTRGLVCITWGKPQMITWAFLNSYLDEAWAVISRDFLTGAGKTPAGFDVAALNADLAMI